MAVPSKPALRITPRVQTWEEGHRRTSTSVNELLTRVAALERVIVELVPAGYGGIKGFGVAGNDLGAGFDTLDYPFTSVVIGAPRGITQDFANGVLRFNASGVWTAMVTISMTHNESNQGRNFSLQFVNLDAVTIGESINIPIARNQPGTLISVTVLADIFELNVGQRIVMQIGNGDAVTGITYDEIRFEATHNSELSRNL